MSQFSSLNLASGDVSRDGAVTLIFLGVLLVGVVTVDVDSLLLPREGVRAKRLFVFPPLFLGVVVLLSLIREFEKKIQIYVLKKERKAPRLDQYSENSRWDSDRK